MKSVFHTGELVGRFNDISYRCHDMEEDAWGFSATVRVELPECWGGYVLFGSRSTPIGEIGKQSHASPGMDDFSCHFFPAVFDILKSMANLVLPTLGLVSARLTGRLVGL